MKGLLSACLFICSTAISVLPSKASQRYWLIIGSYRQGPGSRPEVSGITSPSVYAIPIGSKEECENAGRKIMKEIYKPVWQFDSRWTCIAGSGNSIYR